MVHCLMNAGFTRDTTSALTVYFVMVFFFEIAAVGLHGTAYYGLKRIRIWGRVAAVIAAAAWSLRLTAIPVLVFLLRPQTRQANSISSRHAPRGTPFLPAHPRRDHL